MELPLQAAEEPPSIRVSESQIVNDNNKEADTQKRRVDISFIKPKKPAVRGPFFPVGDEATAFRRRFFPNASLSEWNDWRWQLRSRIKSLAELERVFVLSDGERDAVNRHEGSLPVGITPYYASLMSRTDANEPLRRTHIPVGSEYLKTPGEADDPLGEDHDSAVPGLVHRYPDRVLFLSTAFCSTYCRYCTRSRMVGEAGGDYNFSK